MVVGRQLCVLIAASFVVACGSDDAAPAGAADASPDAPSDTSAGPDASEAGADSEPDTSLPPADSGQETGSDAGGDAATDAAEDGSAGPSAPCLGPGGGGHVQIVSAYWAGTTALGDHLSEMTPALQAGHVDVARLSQPLPDGLDVLVDLHWELFDYTTHTVRTDVDTRLDALEAAATPVLERVRAFYLIDEPYIAAHSIPRAELDKAIEAIEGRFPGIPTYITFAHHCFDPVSTDAACTVPPGDRGIPEELDWVGFDWYNDSNDLGVAATHVPTHVATGVTRIGQLAPAAKVILIPEAYTDGNRVEATAVATLHDYFVLADQQPAVFGVDFFLWADVPPPEDFLGLESLPLARAAVRGFGRWVRKGCGETADLVPVTQWYSASGPDYRYEPWVWDGRSEGYSVDGVAFALAAEGTSGTVPLVHCLVDRGSSVDSFLTLDAGCDGAAVVSAGVVIGGIYPSEVPGTVQLHRYAQQQSPWDHAYALSASASLPAGYSYDWAVGWAFPPAAL